MNRMCESCGQLNINCNGTTQTVCIDCVQYIKEYWGVVTTFDSTGELEVMVGSVITGQKPSNIFEEIEDFHSYSNWFDTEQEANAFAVGLRGRKEII